MAAADNRSQASVSPSASDLSLSFRSLRVQVFTTASIGVTIAAAVAISRAVSSVLGVVIGCVFATYALGLVGYFHRRYRSRLGELVDHIPGATGADTDMEPLPGGVRIYAATVAVLEIATLVSVIAAH